MGVERRSPWQEIEELHRKIDEIVSEFFSGFPSPSPEFQVSFSPSCDIYESDREVVVRFALPGVLEDDVDLSMEGKLLTIRGERSMPPEAERARHLLREIGITAASSPIPITLDTGHWILDTGKRRMRSMSPNSPKSLTFIFNH